MKSANIFKITVLLLGFLFVGSASAQSIFDKFKDKALSKANQQINTNIGNKNFYWARFEVRANWTERGRKIYETRVYYTNLVDLTLNQGNDVNLKSSVIDYFNEGVVEQLKPRGIEINFYDSDVQVYPHSYSYDSREDAQADLDKKIEVDKSNELAIYTFFWKTGAKNVSEDVTQPKRIFGIKNPPASEVQKVEIDTAGGEPKIQNAQNAKQEAEKAQREKQIWGYAILNVRVKKGSKEFSRTYVSEISSVSRADFIAFYNTDERFIKPKIWEYFAATVVKAAKERGEEIEEPYDSNIIYKFSVELSGKHMSAGEDYLFNPKSYLETPRQREVNFAKESGTPVFYFNWDTGGKNIATNLVKESRRGNSANLPN